jgi:iron complex outermembrane recepter protein
VIEGGLRYDIRYIETYATGLINTDPLSPGSKVLPYNKTYNALNGALGFSWFNEKHWNIKSNLSTGYRAGNLAELSSNGLHEGTVRYEIGDINLKIEQNACADLMVAYQSEFITLNASAYYNHFFNYIYLAPSGTQFIGFDIYNYVQQDASLRGVELMADLHPAKVKWLDWISSYSYIMGSLDNGANLPFVPAPKLNSDVKISHEINKKLSEWFIKPGITYVFAQDRPGEFETSTPDYCLFNASAGITVRRAKTNIQLSASGNNLLNKAYYDHLSRFKYFNIYNIGRNISLNFKITFN